MSLHTPSLMSAGRGVTIISPDGSHRIPVELQADYAAIVLLDPEPAEMARWVRRLEVQLGVTDAHRDTLRRRLENRAIRPWTVLRVTSGMERKVAKALGPKTEDDPQGAGLAIYVPIERYRPARTWRSRTRPLMPGYIFADLPDEDSLDLARKNYAVREVMCRDGQPVKVPALAIGCMILMEACGEFDLTWDAPAPIRNKARGRKPTRKWVKGQRVKVADGPLAGFLAEIIKADQADKIAVLVSIFGRETPVELDEEMLDTTLVEGKA
jgi:transcription antitermination factor NusG